VVRVDVLTGEVRWKVGKGRPLRQFVQEPVELLTGKWRVRGGIYSGAGVILGIVLGQLLEVGLECLAALGSLLPKFVLRV
jgi:hypothetical protein